MGDGDVTGLTRNAAVVAAYRQRLKDVAGFKFVPEPIPMRNTRGANCPQGREKNLKSGESNPQLIHECANI